jgi:2-keto-4-pentenoate hydratase
LTRRSTDERIARGMEAQLRALRARLAAGEHQIGWKIALNAPPVQEQLAISAPVIGFLTSGSEIAAGGSHSLAGGTAIGVEAEIAIHVGEDVPPGAARDRLAAAIDALAPAIEIVDIDLPFDDLERILAGNVFHRAVMLGAPDRERAGGDLGGVTVSLSRNGQPEQSANVAGVLGDPTGIVPHRRRSRRGRLRPSRSAQRFVLLSRHLCGGG